MQCSVLPSTSKLSIAQSWLFSAHGICFKTQTSLLTIHPEAENRQSAPDLPGHGQDGGFREPDNNLQPDPQRPRPFYKHISKDM